MHFEGLFHNAASTTQTHATTDLRREAPPARSFASGGSCGVGGATRPLFFVKSTKKIAAFLRTAAPSQAKVAQAICSWLTRNRPRQPRHEHTAARQRILRR